MTVSGIDEPEPTSIAPGARRPFASNRGIDLVVAVPGQAGFRVRASLAKAIPASALASFDLLLEAIVGRFVEQHHDVAVQLRTDPLTQLGNRVAAEEALDRLVAGDVLILIDVDHFKNVNDTFGHASGDAILQHVASFLRSQLRSTDDLCRFGGDELLVVLRDSPHAELAGHAILQRWLAQQPPVTLSAGLARCRSGERGRATLVRADDALYAAKNGGRARLCVDV